MNVVVICHGKAQYDKKGTRLDDTFDGWKRLDYLFDVVFEIGRDPRNDRVRLATVRKTRLSKQFPDGSTFGWSYDALATRWGTDALAKKSTAVEFATEEEVTKFLGLYSQLSEEEIRRIGIHRVIDNAEEARDLPSQRIQRGIEVMESVLNPASAA